MGSGISDDLHEQSSVSISLLLDHESFFNIIVGGFAKVH